MSELNNSAILISNNQNKKSKEIVKRRVFDKGLLAKMKSIVAKYTDRPELLEGIENKPDNQDINFIKELAIDSVDVVEIVVDVEENFGITITDDEIKSFTSFGDMYDLIELKIRQI